MQNFNLNSYPNYQDLCIMNTNNSFVDCLYEKAKTNELDELKKNEVFIDNFWECILFFGFAVFRIHLWR